LRGIVGVRLAGLVPEAAGVVLAVGPDLVLGEARLLIQDPEAPGPAVRVGTRRRAEGVEVERVLADGSDVDDEGVVRLRRREHVELEVLAPRHVPTRGGQDRGDRAPAPLIGRVVRGAEREIQHGLVELGAADPALPVAGAGRKWAGALAGLGPHEGLPVETRSGLDLERERPGTLCPRRGARPRVGTPGFTLGMD